MSPMVNSSNFKNDVNKPGKRKVHPVVPLLFVMILAFVRADLPSQG